MSPVTCQKKIKKIGGASRWRVCYQRGLPRLVFILICIFETFLCDIQGDLYRHRVWVNHVMQNCARFMQVVVRTR